MRRGYDADDLVGYVRLRHEAWAATKGRGRGHWSLSRKTNAGRAARDRAILLDELDHARGVINQLDNKLRGK